MNQQASPGRIVHYVLPTTNSAGEPLHYAGHHRAAVITSDWDGPNQNLTIFHDQTDDDTGGVFNTFGRAWSVPYAENLPDGTYPPGTWHWPERTAEVPQHTPVQPPTTATAVQPPADPPAEVPPAGPAQDPAANNPA